ncbi:MAG: glutamate--tRNA ligase [Holosporales bacterium]|jgi:glutamyl-tRNA synthetase|nr:glutamate--tRNA ligase [Holosporales bacterium]
MSYVVRFAPSPTGLLHIGNIRAALLNYLFVRSFGGKFILRIDDTDKERSSDEYSLAIKQDLAWLGINWDETFCQSSRTDAYKNALKNLKDLGLVYPCYESKEELDIKRKIQLSNRKPPIYDRSALKLSDAKKKELEQNGIKPHWRFKLPDKIISWDDMIYGRIEILPGNTSDPIVAKSDESFVYTFASVVDDLNSKITHIIRGADHLANTASQLHLYGMLGGDATTIKFGHYPLLRDVSGKELSKRLSVLSIKSWREEEIEPMAVNSLLSKIGTSSSIEVRRSMDELIKGFDISSISKAEPKFDSREIYKLNHDLMINTPYEEVAQRLKVIGMPDCNEDFWLMIRGNINRLAEAKTWWNVIYGGVDIFLRPIENQEQEMLKTASDLLFENINLYQSDWGLWFSDIKIKTQKSGRSLYAPIRLCLTGQEHGPELKSILRLMPLDLIKSRLQAGSTKT